MKTIKSLGSVPTNDLVKQYVNDIKANTRAIESGDSETANVYSAQVLSIYRELRARGRQAQDALLPLLSHEDLDVRETAAAHALDFAPDIGLPVLREIEATPAGRFASASARMALMSWEDGNFKIA